MSNGSYSLSGTIFFDAGGKNDGDGDLFDDLNDTPYAGIQVYLWDANAGLVGSTTTDASGEYAFTGLRNGSDYTVSVNTRSLQISSMDLTASVNPGYSYHTVTSSGTDITDQDFGFFASADFGDLPLAYNVTRILNEGPYHLSGPLYLGLAVDTEPDGQEDPVANGDTYDDGVTYDRSATWAAGSTINLAVTISGATGYLIAWFDWNGDFSLNGPGERVIFGSLAPGTHILSLTIPDAYSRSIPVNSRFRLYDSMPAVISPIGGASNGEVEDYQWSPFPTAVTLISLDATPKDRSVLVSWESASEINILGFNLYQADSLDGPWTLLNDQPIPSVVPGAVEGAVYSYLDSSVEPGRTYYYRLDAIDFNGVPESFGPVAVLVPAMRLEVPLHRIYMPMVFK